MAQRRRTNGGAGSPWRTLGSRAPRRATIRNGCMTAPRRRRRVGRLASGEPYYAPMGADALRRRPGSVPSVWPLAEDGGWQPHDLGARHDGRGVQGVVPPERQCLDGGAGDRERKRETMLAQIASGERDQSVLGRPSPPTVPRWRSLTVLHPQLMDGVAPDPQPRPRPLQRRSVFASEDLVALPGVRTRVASHAP